LRYVLGDNVVDDFKDIFDKYDRHDDGVLELNDALEGFDEMGGKATLHELRKWIKLSIGVNNRMKTSLNLSEFILAYANLFFPAEFDLAEMTKQDENKLLGRSLRLNGEVRDMAAFAAKFGKKLLRELESAFDKFATTERNQSSSDENPKMLARDIISCFLSMGKAITVTRLLEWMNEADISPQDKLSLADFAVVYSYFFHPTVSDMERKNKEGANNPFVRMTLSEIAIQVLQEERWKGSTNQTILFIQRLSAGRSDMVVGCIEKLREAFDALDSNNTGEVSITKIDDLFQFSGISNSSTIKASIQKFCVRIEQQGRENFIFPEIFENFGSFIQEHADASLGIAEAFAMLRMHCSLSDIRSAADMSLRIIDNILNNTGDSKYWQINVQSQVRRLFIYFFFKKIKTIFCKKKYYIYKKKN
jgi:Ca2+-binding EF-hand superfamily protein